MHVIKYEVHNVLRISDLEMDMEGRHLVLVGGKNAQGKTSAIDALLMAVCGRRGMDYPAPALKEGEKEGWVHVQLTGSEKFLEDQHVTLQLFLKRKRGGEIVEKFRILDSSGAEAPNPRKLLGELYSLRGFDPLGFDYLSRREQREVLMSITGLDLEAFRKQHKEVFDERAAVNRDVKRAEHRFEEMPHYPDAPREPVDVKDLMKQLKGGEEHNSQVSDALKELAACQETEASSRATLLDLQDQLKIAEAAVKAAEKGVTAAEKIVKDLGEARDLASIKTQISEAGETNERVTANAARLEARKGLDVLEEKSEELTEKLKDLEADQDQKMKDAAWPVEGLSVDDEGVLFNELPYEQASAAERLRISTRIGMAQNPELRLLVSEHGNDLDIDSLKELEKELIDGDFQMILEFVTRTEEDESLCAVVLEDGKAKTT